MKKRYCNCGRELEKYQKKECTECVAINIQISKDCYATTDEYKQSQDKYNKSEKGKIARRRADKKWRENNPEYVKQRMREYRRSACQK